MTIILTLSQPYLKKRDKLQLWHIDVLSPNKGEPIHFFCPERINTEDAAIEFVENFIEKTGLYEFL